MSDVVELAEVPELFERWLAGRPLGGLARGTGGSRSTCHLVCRTSARRPWARGTRVRSRDEFLQFNEQE